MISNNKTVPNIIVPDIEFLFTKYVTMQRQNIDIFDYFDFEIQKNGLGKIDILTQMFNNLPSFYGKDHIIQFYDKHICKESNLPERIIYSFVLNCLQYVVRGKDIRYILNHIYKKPLSIETY